MKEKRVGFLTYVDVYWSRFILNKGTLDKNGRQIIVIPHYKRESTELSAALSFITQLFR